MKPVYLIRKGKNEQKCLVMRLSIEVNSFSSPDSQA